MVIRENQKRNCFKNVSQFSCIPYIDADMNLLLLLKFYKLNFFVMIHWSLFVLLTLAQVS